MFDKITVQEWMTSPVITVKPGTRIADAHQLMKEKNIRRLLVVDHDVLVGIVTIGDIREASPSDATTLSIWELNYLWAQLTVEKVMTADPLTVSPSTPILDAAEMMLEHKVAGLPVVDEQKHVLGIITESDLFRMLVRSRTVSAQ